jgi:hypothetical protein
VTIVDTINETHARLIRMKRLRDGLITVAYLTYLALGATALGFIAGWLSSLTAIVGCAVGIGLALRHQLFRSPDVEAACRFIDSRYDTRDRALTLAAAWHDAGDAERGLLEKQLDEIVPPFDVAAAIPLALDTRLRRLTYSVPVALGVLLFLQGGRHEPAAPAAEAQAQIIAAVLEENRDIPLAVRETLVDLKNTLESTPLTDAAVQEALARAQAEVAAAQSETTGEDGDTIEQETTDGASSEPSSGDVADTSPSNTSPVGRTPTPTPEPTATPTPAPAAGEPPPAESPASTEPDKEEEPAPQDTDVQNAEPSPDGQGEADKKSDSTSDGSDGSEQKQSSAGSAGAEKQDQSGKEGKEGQAESKDSEQGEGDGQGSSSKPGKQDGQSQGQGNSQGQTGQQGQQQGEGSGKEGSNSSPQSGTKGEKGAKSGSQTGQGNSGLERAEKALNQLEQELKAEQKNAQQGQQQGEQQGGEQGSEGQQPSGAAGGDKKEVQPGAQDSAPGQGKGKPQGNKKEPTPGKKSEPNDQPGRENEGKGGGKGGQNDSPPKDSKSHGGQQGDDAPKEEFGAEPNLPAKSSLPETNEAAQELGAEPGGKEGGLEGKTEFRDSEIKAGDEKYDTRFIGKDGKVGLNTSPARTKTRLEDVKLAKPEAVTDPSEQPIPLEYRDILQ